MRLLLLLVSTAALAAVAAGCGGGGSSSSTTTIAEGTPVVEWAGDFCTAVSTWKGSLVTTAKDLSPTKDGLRKAADEVKSANQKLSDDLSSLGKPDTESGQKVKQSLDDLSKTIDTQGQKIDDTVQNASGVSGLLSAGATISSSLSTMYKALSNTFTALDQADVKGEMKTAFDQAPSCKTLRSSSG